jgi:hypothetical protein
MLNCTLVRLNHIEYALNAYSDTMDACITLGDNGLYSFTNQEELCADGVGRVTKLGMAVR